MCGRNKERWTEAAIRVNEDWEKNLLCGERHCVDCRVSEPVGVGVPSGSRSVPSRSIPVKRRTRGPVEPHQRSRRRAWFCATLVCLFESRLAGNGLVRARPEFTQSVTIGARLHNTSKWLRITERCLRPGAMKSAGGTRGPVAGGAGRGPPAPLTERRPDRASTDRCRRHCRSATDRYLGRGRWRRPRDDKEGAGATATATGRRRKRPWSRSVWIRTVRHTRAPYAARSLYSAITRRRCHQPECSNDVVTCRQLISIGWCCRWRRAADIDRPVVIFSAALPKEFHRCFTWCFFCWRHLRTPFRCSVQRRRCWRQGDDDGQ